MTTAQIQSPRFYDGLVGYGLRLAASGLLPAAWFRDPIPDEASRKPSPEFPTLEIVSHCWQYAHMLAYQLSSFVLHPPTRLDAVITVYHAVEDTATRDLLGFIGGQDIPHVRWNWQPLPKEQLFRRAIGRNRSALSTPADWVWMTDCDIVFHEHCLDSVADRLRGRRDVLVYPRQERTTSMLPSSNPMLQKGRQLQLVDIDAGEFNPHTRDRAKGAFQIIHGDVARAIGYCNGIRLYQTPSRHWCKCYEDRAFRWLVGTPGTPVDIDGVHQIRHIEKGRYAKGSAWSRLRSKIRRMQE
jgi:hypothetical protein